jgi:hypothetical protein
MSGQPGGDGGKLAEQRRHQSYFEENPLRRIGFGIFLAAVFGYVAWTVIVAINRPYAERRSWVCAANMRYLSHALELYRADNDDRFCAAANWSDALLPYVDERSKFVCPEASHTQCSYALNSALERLRPAMIVDPHLVIALYESDAGWNAADGANLLPVEPRHFGGDHVFRADGSSSGYDRRKSIDPGGWHRRRWLKQYDRSDLTWVPHLKDGAGADSPDTGGRPAVR